MTYRVEDFEFEIELGVWCGCDFVDFNLDPNGLVHILGAEFDTSLTDNIVEEGWRQLREGTFNDELLESVMSKFDPNKQSIEQYDGDCTCDPSVGFTPCEFCHDRHVIGKLRAENERLRAKVERLTKRGFEDLNWENNELREENERLRGLLKKCGNISNLGWAEAFDIFATINEEVSDD